MRASHDAGKDAGGSNEISDAEQQDDVTVLALTAADDTVSSWRGPPAKRCTEATETSPEAVPAADQQDCGEFPVGRNSNSDQSPIPGRRQDDAQCGQDVESLLKSLRHPQRYAQRDLGLGFRV